MNIKELMMRELEDGSLELSGCLLKYEGKDQRYIYSYDIIKKSLDNDSRVLEKNSIFGYFPYKHGDRPSLGDAAYFTSKITVASDGVYGTILIDPRLKAGKYLIVLIQECLDNNLDINLDVVGMGSVEVSDYGKYKVQDGYRLDNFIFTFGESRQFKEKCNKCNKFKGHHNDRR